MTRVLVVDDDEAIRTLVRYNFAQNGYAVDLAHDGLDAMDSIQSADAQYDLIILDLMMPKMDGLEVCKRIRRQKIMTPVIILTAKDDEIDRVLSLEFGADDYVTKPFSPRELLARARAILRRIDGQQVVARTVDHDQAGQLRLGNILLNRDQHEVYLSGVHVPLTLKEFELLGYLMEHKGHVISREQLVEAVWGYAMTDDTRIVDVHISRLRNKIEMNAGSPKIITIRGVGYKLVLGNDA